MPEHKNQHYVPQHYLKGWAEDRKISVYRIDDGAVPVKTSIDNICSEDTCTAPKSTSKKNSPSWKACTKNR